MPLYEYECPICKHRFEELQKIADEPLQICPKCGKKRLVKLISNTSFQLKGTGWYVTDFKDKKPASEKPKEHDSKKSDTKKEIKKTEKPKEKAKK